MNYEHVLIPDYLKTVLNAQGYNNYQNGFFMFHRMLNDGAEESKNKLKNFEYIADISKVMKESYSLGIAEMLRIKRENYQTFFGERFQTLEVRTFTPLVIGVGEKTVSENSMTIHPVYGIPYIPGQAIKGLLRSYYINEFFSGNEVNALANPVFQFIFGKSGDGTKENPGSQGKVCFFDAYPVNAYFSLSLEIANNHNPLYYSKGASITDRENPNPVKFIALADMTVSFSLLLPKYIQEKIMDDEQFESYYGYSHGSALMNTLRNALSNYGIGAKTAIGYGRFR